MSTRRYPDPHWITVRWDCSCSTCGNPVRKGEQGWYYPASRSVLCSRADCGQQAALDFRAAVDDERQQLAGGVL